MTDEIPERYQGQYCTIKRRVGNFNFADPSEESAQVTVVLPEHNFIHGFKFDPDFPIVERMPWHDAIDEICYATPRLMGDREPHERLNEIFKEYQDEIIQEWEQYRLDEIEDEIESLKEEKQSLQ